MTASKSAKFGRARWAAMAACAVAAVTGTGLAHAQVFLGGNFQGSVNDVGSIPPDTNAAAGVEHFVEAINGRFAIYRKSDGVRVSSSTLSAFWTSRGITLSNARAFDPRVVYDWAARRYYLAALDGSSSAANNAILVAASNTSDPTGAWTVQRIPVSPTLFADFDQLGFTSTHVTLTTNNFVPAGSFSNVAVFSIPKASVFSGNTNSALLASGVNSNTTGFTPQPAMDLWGTATVGQQALFSTYNSNTLAVTTVSTTGSTPVVSGARYLTVTNYGTANQSRQPTAANVTVALDSGGTRISGNVVRQGDSYWMVHTVAGSGNQPVLRWYRVNATTLALAESGTIEDANFDFIYPSIAVTPAGNIVIGFSRTGPTSTSGFPSAAFVTGTFNGTTTTISNTPVITRAGAASYQETYTGTRNRWGDYSAVSVDPADPFVVWNHQEYANSAAIWGLQHTEVIFPQAGETRWSNAASGTFSTSGSWLTSTAPAAGSTAVFSRATTPGLGYTVSLTGATTLGRISVRQGTVVLATGSNSLTLTSDDASGSLVVGEFGGAPNLTITGTGTLTTGQVNVAPSNASSGRVRLTGPTWNASGGMYVGGTALGAGGTAHFSGDAGALTLAGPLVVYRAGTVALSGSALVSTPTLQLNSGLVTTGAANLAAPTVSHTGGTLSFTSAVTLAAGSGIGSVAMTGGALTSSGAFTVGAGASVTQSGGVFTAVGLNVTGGRFSFNSGAITFGGPLVVTAGGAWSSSATGSFNLGNTTVSGSGSLISFGGASVTQLNGLTASVGSQGRFVSSSYSVQPTGSVIVSGGTVAVTGSLGVGGTLNVNSGRVSAGNVAINGGRITVGSTASFDPGTSLLIAPSGTFTAAGSFTLGHTTATGTGSLINLGAVSTTIGFQKTVNVTGGAQFNAASLFLDDVSTLDVAGGTVSTTGSISLGDGAAIAVNGGRLSGGLVISPGSIRQAGGVVTIGDLVGTGSVTVTASGSFQAATVQASRMLVDASTAKLDGGNSDVSEIASISVTNGGLLDLTGQYIAVAGGGTSLASLRSMAESWWNGGARNGPGIGSSLASAANFTTVAVFPNSDDGGVTSFYGAVASSVLLFPNDVLLRRTYIGDTNIDGRLDGNDLADLLEGLSAGLTGWQNGDVNYDGVVNATDYSLFSAAFSAYQANLLPALGSPSDVPPGGGAPVPEPSAAIGVVAGGLALLGRRRRSSR